MVGVCARLEIMQGHMSLSNEILFDLTCRMQQKQMSSGRTTRDSRYRIEYLIKPDLRAVRVSVYTQFVKTAKIEDLTQDLCLSRIKLTSNGMFVVE